jgi:hypothetical protein
VQNEEIVCCLGIYFLSERVIRARGFFCESKWRNKGLMKFCFEKTLALYNLRADKILVFSPSKNAGYYLGLGFKQESTTPRPLEYYDFESHSYKTTEDVVILERLLSI